MQLGDSNFSLTDWAMHLVRLAAAAVTFSGIYWLYHAFPPARRRLAVVLLLLGLSGFLFACGLGLRIMFPSLSSSDAFMISLIVYSSSFVLSGLWIVRLEHRNRDGPARH